MIFAGHQHEQAWNEMLIGVAAVELARDPEGLFKMLGAVQFWKILDHAHKLHTSSSPQDCFRQFWERLKGSVTRACITPTQDGSIQPPNGVFFPDKKLSQLQGKAFQEIGGSVVVDELRPFRAVMLQVGTPILTLARLVIQLEKAMTDQDSGADQVEKERLEGFYLPLWNILNDLLPEPSSKDSVPPEAIQQLESIPIVVTEDLFIVNLEESRTACAPVDAAQVASLLPRMAITTHHILGFPRLAKLIRNLDLGAIVEHLVSMLADEPVENIIGVADQQLRDLYKLFAELDQQGATDDQTYRDLLDLPIWPSSHGLIAGTQALLPGDFTDPIGLSDLLDTSILTGSARTFVSTKLGVKTQTIEAFVEMVLPDFFDEDGPDDEQKYGTLIKELANHPALLNNTDICRLLASLPIIPTQNGQWSRPAYSYRRTDALIKLLGDAKHLWLDDSRIPDQRSVHTFINSLGIRHSPLSQHLVERMRFIAETHPPTEDAKRSSGNAFYALCDAYDKWKDQSFFQDAISELAGIACFPAEDDREDWHQAISLHAPYRADAFRSQANILDFKNTGRLNTELLKKLGVTIKPGTSMVIKHLRYCVDEKIPPHNLTYQVLNERAPEDPLISTLADFTSIYVASQKRFVRPNQLYWLPQQLGQYAFTIPNDLETFKPLFTAIGVKDSPQGKDFVDILLEIVGKFYEQAKSLEGQDKAVYEACLAGASTADEQKETGMAEEIRRLQEAPTITNLLGEFTHPDEVLLQDSEWHTEFFQGELDRALCKPAPELWPFIKKIGVKHLSENAEVELDFVDGEKHAEHEIAEKLMARVEILIRYLHDKPVAARNKVQTTLSTLEASSYDSVKIQAFIYLSGNKISAPPTATPAFFDIDDRQIILTRPVDDRSWPHVLKAVFHQLMPEETGSNIAKLVLGIGPLMKMPVEEAHRDLTDAGIPTLDSSTDSSETEDLSSPDLGEMGTNTDSGSEEETKGSPINDQDRATADSDPHHEPKPEPNNNSRSKHGETSSNQPQHGNDTTEPRQHSAAPDKTAGQHSGGSTLGQQDVKKPRPKHKDQWDRRLLSYVRRKQEDSSTAENEDNLSKHNLAVEVIARGAVSRYEKERGRDAEQMAQTHPGYDIISRDPITGEVRYIEVKGVNGEWNQTGVGLSRLQFSNAQEYGDGYWLYVVEFTSDPQNIRVHAICSPAMQVTSFMFDGNWRDAVTDERADPTMQFVPGVRIEHQDMGQGEIRKVDVRETTKLLTIQFDDKPQPCAQRHIESTSDAHLGDW